MNTLHFKDCYFEFKDSCFIIGNSSIERKMQLSDGNLRTVYILNKTTGFSWQGGHGKSPSLFACESDSPAKVDCLVDNCGGLSGDHLAANVTFSMQTYDVRLEFLIFPETPFLTFRMFLKGRPALPAASAAESEPEESSGIETGTELKRKENTNADCIDRIGVSGIHFKHEVIRLIDGTDMHDVLVQKQKGPLSCTKKTTMEGSMLILDDYLSNEQLMLVKEAPMPQCALHRSHPDFSVMPGEYVEVDGCGIDFAELKPDEELPCYGVSAGVGSSLQLKLLYKRFYSGFYRGSSPFIMSNTWGDRNQDAAVCEEFVLKEIDAAEKLGVDYVQIDDGWQKGKTANSKLASGGTWGKYYSVDTNFWDFDAEKFPHGFKPVAEYAEAHGVKLALWFSPDSTNGYENWEKDSECMLRLHREYGICFFKLDGIQINSKQGEINIVRMLSTASRDSDNKISFNLDITAQRRFGYLYEKRFGTLFVENRYTDWGNYYPHNTLKNLWCLSEIMPTRKMQFEVLNNRRNTDKYHDILAPEQYSADYLFASVMVSNPLMWMELSRLDLRDQNSLAAVIAVYKQHRKNFYHAEILPVGEMPDGCSFTGFQIKTSESEGYVILFRENTVNSEYSYSMDFPEQAGMRFDILYSNAESESLLLEKEKNLLKVEIGKERTCVFAKYRMTEQD